MYRASTTTSIPFSARRSRTLASCSALVSLVTGRWWKGTPWACAHGARSGWLEPTSGISASSSPAPQEVRQAVVVAGDEDRHPLRGVGVGEAPVHAVAAGEGTGGAGGRAGGGGGAGGRRRRAR